MTDQEYWITPHPHDEHKDPAEHWRDCHDCAKELLQRLANGVLVVDRHTFEILYAKSARKVRAKNLSIAREVVKDDK